MLATKLEIMGSGWLIVTGNEVNMQSKPSVIVTEYVPAPNPSNIFDV